MISSLFHPKAATLLVNIQMVSIMARPLWMSLLWPALWYIITMMSPQMVYLHALLHGRLPQQHLPLHCGLQGKSVIFVLKLGHKFYFQRGLGPHQEQRVHGGQHCHHHRLASHHHCYRARLPFQQNLGQTGPHSPAHNSCSWDVAAYSYPVGRLHTMMRFASPSSSIENKY